MSRSAHPARSLDFLSRLHDGDLTAAERAHFESHRAHCDECRQAAAEFEDTLAYYRTAGTPAAKPDLAARILRKLQSASPRPRPFGVVFGIDLKWAGAFIAALVVTILGYSLVERRRESSRIPVSFREIAAAPTRLASAPAGAEAPVDEDRRAVSPQRQARAKVARDAMPVAAVPVPAAPPERKDTEASAAAKPKPEAKPAASSAAGNAASLEASAQAPQERSPAARADQAAALDKSTRLRAEIALQAAAAPAPAPPLRLTVEALDGEGTPPAVLNEREVAVQERDRGRYVATVGADGIPIDVHREGESPEESPAPAKLQSIESLRKLRFAPADRPRRLLLRVEPAPKG